MPGRRGQTNMRFVSTAQARDLRRASDCFAAKVLVGSAGERAIPSATERAPTIPRNGDSPDERFRLWAGAAARDRVGDVRMESSCLLVGGNADLPGLLVDLGACS